MFLHHSCQIFLLWTIFLMQDVLGFCERPAWTRVAWEMTPQDLELVTKEQSILFHSSICRIYQCFTGIGLTKGCLEVVNVSYKVALVIAIGLAVHFLLSKLKLIKSTKSENPTTAVSVVTEMNDDYSHDMNKMLYKLVTNTSKMMKYMKRVTYHHKREIKYRQLNKKRKYDDYDDYDEDDEDEQLFPVCLHNHSSTAGTI